MRNTFLDKNHQHAFEQLGYILQEGFLNASEVEKLREFYTENKEERTGFHATMHSKNFDLRHKISQFISEVFLPKSSILLDDYRPVVGNFTVKEPGEASFFDFHLDWNMLDERFARSVTIWVALEDTNAKNGNLWILERSNIFPDTYRCGPGLNLLSEDLKHFDHFKFEKKILPMSAGDAIIYDHKLIHGSPPNLSDHARLAINLALLPKEVQALHYFYENGSITTYQVPDSFFNECLTHEPMNMDSYPIKSSGKNDIHFVHQKTLNNLIQTSGIA